MRQELSELLLRIISSSCGIEEEQRFYRIALSEIHRCFKAQGAQLFVKGEDAGGYDQLAFYQKDQKLHEILSSMLRSRDVLQGDLLEPLFRKTPESTYLFLPLKDDRSPRMLLCLSWKDIPPPEWIRDEEMIVAFNKKLGSYLPWKHVMLKIAAAKRNLERIFDHLPGAVGVIGSDYTIERVNKAFTKLFDVPFNEAIGKKCYQVVHRGTAPHPDCRMQSAIEAQQKMSTEIENGKRLRVTFLPLVAHNSEPKSLQIFQLQDEPDESHTIAQSYDFLQLYNLLSQPLTVLSLMSGIMTSMPSNEAINAEYLGIIRKEVDAVIMILREAYAVVTSQGEVMVGGAYK